MGVAFRPGQGLCPRSQPSWPSSMMMMTSPRASKWSNSAFRAAPTSLAQWDSASATVHSHSWWPRRAVRRGCRTDVEPSERSHRRVLRPPAEPIVENAFRRPPQQWRAARATGLLGRLRTRAHDTIALVFMAPDASGWSLWCQRALPSNSAPNEPSPGPVVTPTVAAVDSELVGQHPVQRKAPPAPLGSAGPFPCERQAREKSDHLSSALLLPRTRRAMIRFWICWVPSKISRILESRAHFSTKRCSE